MRSSTARSGAVEARIGALQAQIDELTARAVDLENQAAAARGQLDEAKRRASAAAAAMYRSDDLASMYADMLDVDDVNQVASGSKYLRHISDLRQTQVEALAGLKQQIETLQQEADAQRKQVSDAQAQARQERAEIAGLRAEQQQKRDAAAGEEAHEQTLVASIRSQKDKFNAQLSSLQAASNAASALLAAKQRGQTRGSSFHVRRPVPGAITDGFGPRVHPILGTVRIHTGVDMHAAQGEPIHAAAAGVVAFAGVKGGYGNAVIIDHGGQFATLYGHSSKLLVTTGQKVERGAGDRARGRHRPGDRPSPPLRGPHPRRPREPRPLHVALRSGGGGSRPRPPRARRPSPWVPRTARAPASRSRPR